MRRVAFGLFVLLTMLVITERRLSDGWSHRAKDPTPELWEPAQHAARTPGQPLVEPSSPGIATATHATPANCGMVMSVHYRTRHTFTSIEQGVTFDIDGDGDADRVSWTEAGSDIAFLALDVNGDGRITSGRELVGAHAVAGARNGPTALIALAADAAGGERRGVVDSENPLFFKLLLWTDANHNGVGETAELRSAHQVLSGIGLGFQFQHRKDRHGNESRYRGFVHVRTAPGLNAITSSQDDIDRRRPMYDVCLVAREKSDP
jgi:hypothetical protein